MYALPGPHTANPCLLFTAVFHINSCEIYPSQALLLHSKRSSLKARVFSKPPGPEWGEQGPGHTFHTSPAFSPYREAIHLHATLTLIAGCGSVPVLPPGAGLLLPARPSPNEPFMPLTSHKGFYFLGKRAHQHNRCPQVTSLGFWKPNF